MNLAEAKTEPQQTAVEKTALIYIIVAAMSKSFFILVNY